VRGEPDRKRAIRSFQDLDVYRKLVELHLKVHRRTLQFPIYEKYELGSQLRRSSNAIPANLAEGWNNRHIAMYLEGINRAFGELRETVHHLCVARRKGHLQDQEFGELESGYEECSRMLRGLERAIRKRLDEARKS
jgi:four helix bundle protein